MDRMLPSNTVRAAPRLASGAARRRSIAVRVTGPSGSPAGLSFAAYGASGASRQLLALRVAG